METIIRTANLGLKIGNKYILQNINLEINKGEHWLIFGLNGCGKTSLTNILSGYGYYTEGTLSVFGDTFNNKNTEEKRKKIGYVSLSFFEKIYFNESVLDIVLSGINGTLVNNTFPLDTRHYKLAYALLDEFGVLEKKYMPFSNLSKGQRQNVLIARALISKPEILILDEPASGLDVFNRERLLSIIKMLANETELTILYITHYTEEILEEFDRCILMKSGGIYQAGKTKKIFNSENISQFLNHPVELSNKSKRLHLYLNVSSRIKELLNY